MGYAGPHAERVTPASCLHAIRMQMRVSVQANDLDGSCAAPVRLVSQFLVGATLTSSCTVSQASACGCQGLAGQL